MCQEYFFGFLDGNRRESTVYNSRNRERYDHKKIFLTAVGVSLAVHIAVLALAGFLGGGDSTGREDVFIVTLEKRPDFTAESSGSEGKAAAGPLEEIRERVRDGSVDTVSLDSTDTKYHPYLLQVKKRIGRQ